MKCRELTIPNIHDCTKKLMDQIKGIQQGFQDGRGYPGLSRLEHGVHRELNKILH